MDEILFLPPRTRGILIHIGAIFLLIALSGGSLWLGLQQEIGSYFVLLLALSVLLVPPLIWAGYRGYALLRASYTLGRDGLRLRWGLRSEDVPLPDIEWARPASQMGFHLPLPWLRLPGAILGSRNVEGLGPVEYMASEVNSMVLVATSQKVFAISPADPDDFLQAFQLTMEMGSLAPLPSRSALPAAYLQNVWTDLLARRLILSGLFISIALFIYVSLIVPTLPPISLGFSIYGLPGETGPAETLLLLPVLALFTFGMDLLLGLFFYRHPEERSISYLLWGASAVTPILLMIATVFITSAV